MVALDLLKRTISEFAEDQCTTLAAALAFYTAFALPPLLYLLFATTSYGLSTVYESKQAEVEAERLLTTQAARLIGNSGAVDEIATMLEQQQKSTGQWWKTLLSFIGILIGATGVMAALQAALNQVWGVQPNPDKSLVGAVIKKRLISLAMILGFAFLLLVSLIASSVFSMIAGHVGRLMGMSGTLVMIADWVVQALMDFAIFLAILRFMPDAVVRWKDALVGAGLTTALFLIGRTGMQLYFSYSEPGAQFGAAAASMAVLLLWVYYSALIILLGAEATHVYAVLRGEVIRPEEHATKQEGSKKPVATTTPN